MAGDEQAWHALYEENFDALYRYVQWRCGGMSSLGEETVQETWLTAVRKIRRFDPRQGTFQAWVRGIAANQLRNQFRRQRAGTGSTGELDWEQAISLPPEAAAENREQAEQIAAALAALPTNTNKSCGPNTSMPSRSPKSPTVSVKHPKQSNRC